MKLLSAGLSIQLLFFTYPVLAQQPSQRHCFSAESKFTALCAIEETDTGCDGYADTLRKCGIDPEQLRRAVPRYSASTFEALTDAEKLSLGQESDEVRAYCEYNYKMAAEYDCGCVADEFVAERIAAGPTADRNNLLLEVMAETQCADIEGMLAAQERSCRLSGINAPGYCDCWIDELRSSLEAGSGTGQGITKSMQRDASEACAAVVLNQLPGNPPSESAQTMQAETNTPATGGETSGVSHSAASAQPGVAAASSTPSEPTAADYAGLMSFRDVPPALLAYKLRPDLYSDDAFLKMTEYQIRSDQQIYAYKGSTRPGTIPRTEFAIFSEEEVAGREASFASRDLVTKYRAIVDEAAANLPDTFVMTFSPETASFKYDFNDGVLYNARNSWSCGMYAPLESCLESGLGSHFFLGSGRQFRSENLARFGDLAQSTFLFRADFDPATTKERPRELDLNVPLTFSAGFGLYVGHDAFFLAFDRDLSALATVAVTPEHAERLLTPPPGTTRPFGNFQAVLVFRVTRITRVDPGWAFSAVVDGAAIYAPDNQLLLESKGIGLPLVEAASNAPDSSVVNAVPPPQSEPVADNTVGLTRAELIAAGDEGYRQCGELTSDEEQLACLETLAESLCASGKRAEECGPLGQPMMGSSERSALNRDINRLKRAIDRAARQAADQG